ncbi:nucleotidyltransferase domain-containing protein [Candidatus Wolfebacteria bacterium]|nr:nucleotidyltransferase domain-containing protein [Candidatus Wolfebacteria bacterium]
MKKNNQFIFIQALNKVVKLCRSKSELLNDIKFIALLGSVKDNEAVENYSDLDILFILESNQSGLIKKNVLEKLKTICEIVSKEYNIKISILPHSIYDFKTYVDFEYLTHYSWGKVFYGSATDFKRFFRKILKLKMTDEKQNAKVILFNLIHARFNFVRKYVSWNKYNTTDYHRALLKLCIDNIFEICDWCLIYNNYWAKTKKEIVYKFNEQFGDKIAFNNIPQWAYFLRKNWNTLKIDKNIKDFCSNTTDFIQNCVKIINHL